MGDLLARILVAGLLLLSVVAAFDSRDLTLSPFALSGRKFIKQNTHIPIQCMSLKDGNVSLVSSVPNFKWTAGPMPVMDAQGSVVGSRQPMAFGTIDHFGPSDAGTYTCHVSMHGEVVGEKSVTLELYQSLNLSATQTSVLSHVGADEVQLYCAVMQGTGGVNITWLNANGTEISTASPFMFPRYTVHGPNLTIRQVERSDAGPYFCNVAQTIKNANDDGSDLIDSDRVVINLHVEHTPEFAHAVVEVQRDTKDAVHLVCDVQTGVPNDIKPPTFSWYRNETNMSVKGDDNLGFPPCRDRECVVRFDDLYRYDQIKCVADNGLGMAEKVFKVVEGIRQTTEPDVPTGSPVSNPGNILPKVTGATPSPQVSGASAAAIGLAVLMGAVLVAFV